MTESLQRKLRSFNDVQTEHAGPWKIQAASLGLFFVVAGWYLLREPSIWLAVVTVIGILWVRPVLRHAQRQREERRRLSPDVRQPD